MIAPTSHEPNTEDERWSCFVFKPHIYRYKYEATLSQNIAKSHLDGEKSVLDVDAFDFFTRKKSSRRRADTRTNTYVDASVRRALAAPRERTSGRASRRKRAYVFLFVSYIHSSTFVSRRVADSHSHSHSHSHRTRRFERVRCR